MIALLAAAMSLVTAGAPSTAYQRCAAYEPRGTVGGRVVCLSQGAACRSRYQQRYSRYGFQCRGGHLEYNWDALRRPLHVPAIAAGAPCPASSPHQSSDPSVPSPPFGPGPAYPTLDGTSGRAIVVMVWPPTQPPYLGWAGTKVLWTVPRYKGPVLIRGRQLDGPNEVGFDLGPGWTGRVLPEIRLVGPQVGLRPAATFVPSPGCYAYQIDTVRSSYLIVFDAQIGYR